MPESVFLSRKTLERPPGEGAGVISLFSAEKSFPEITLFLKTGRNGISFRWAVSSALNDEVPGYVIPRKWPCTLPEAGMTVFADKLSEKLAVLKIANASVIRDSFLNFNFMISLHSSYILVRFAMSLSANTRFGTNEL